ncbi:unnamed protein product [Penicillium manginii]
MQLLAHLYLLIVSAALIAAQDPTPVATPEEGGCASQQRIVDQCVLTMRNALAKCQNDNWDCKCSAQANIANCYVDCLNNKDSFSAQLSSAEICATANAYDAGLTNVPATWTTPGPAAATPAQISDIDDDEFDTKKSASSSEPTKSLTEEKSATTSEGAAAGKAAGSWLALVGLGIGMVF